MPPPVLRLRPGELPVRAGRLVGARGHRFPRNIWSRAPTHLQDLGVTQLRYRLAADRLDPLRTVGHPATPVIEPAGHVVVFEHPEHGPPRARLPEPLQGIDHQLPAEPGADQLRIDMDRVQLGRAGGLARAEVGEAGDLAVLRGPGPLMRLLLPAPSFGPPLAERLGRAEGQRL